LKRRNRTPRRAVTSPICSVSSSEARARRRTAARPRARTVEAPTDDRTERRRRSMRWTSSKRCVRIDSISLILVFVLLSLAHRVLARSFVRSVMAMKDARDGGLRRTRAMWRFRGAGRGGRAVESDFRFTSIDDWFFIMNRAIRRSSQRMDGEKQRVPCD